MGIHGDDVVRSIRTALREDNVVGFVSEVRATPRPDPDDGWRYRDGKQEFDITGRDFFRAFTITIEAKSVEDFVGDPQCDDWVDAETGETLVTTRPE